MHCNRPAHAAISRREIYMCFGLRFSNQHYAKRSLSIRRNTHIYIYIYMRRMYTHTNAPQLRCRPTTLGCLRAPSEYMNVYTCICICVPQGPRVGESHHISKYMNTYTCICTCVPPKPRVGESRHIRQALGPPRHCTACPCPAESLVPPSSRLR